MSHQRSEISNLPCLVPPLRDLPQRQSVRVKVKRRFRQIAFKAPLSFPRGRSGDFFTFSIAPAIHPSIPPSAQPSILPFPIWRELRTCVFFFEGRRRFKALLRFREVLQGTWAIKGKVAELITSRRRRWFFKPFRGAITITNGIYTSSPFMP